MIWTPRWVTVRPIHQISVSVKRIRVPCETLQDVNSVESRAHMELL